MSQSTRRFVLGAGDEKEAEEIITRFRLTEAAGEVVRHKLKGPDETGSGLPFLAIVDADNVPYEQMLVNSLGLIKLWAFSATPTDAALRNRLYELVGFSEGYAVCRACSRPDCQEGGRLAQGRAAAPGGK